MNNCSCKTYNMPSTTSQNKVFAPMFKSITVLDANNEPFPNVYVSNLTTQQGTITNFDGQATIAGNFLDTIEINHMSHDVEQFTFGELPKTVKLSKPHTLDEVTIIAEPKQAGIGIALAIAGLGLLFALNSQSAPKGLNAPKNHNKPIKVTL